MGLEGLEDVIVLGERLDLWVFFEMFTGVDEQVVGGLNMGVLELFLLLVLVLILLSVDINGLLLGINIGSVVILGLVPLIIINQLIVQVLELSQEGNDPSLVLLLTLLLEPVLFDLQHLQFVVKSRQIVNTLIQVVQLILSDRQHIQVDKGVEAFQFADLVIEEGKVLKLSEGFQALDLLNHVEAEVKPLQLGEVFEAADLGDDVVVKLEFGQVVHALQVTNRDDVYTNMKFMSVIKLGGATVL